MCFFSEVLMDNDVFCVILYNLEFCSRILFKINLCCGLWLITYKIPHSTMEKHCRQIRGLLCKYLFLNHVFSYGEDVDFCLLFYLGSEVTYRYTMDLQYYSQAGENHTMVLNVPTYLKMTSLFIFIGHKWYLNTRYKFMCLTIASELWLDVYTYKSESFRTLDISFETAWSSIHTCSCNTKSKRNHYRSTK